MPARLVVDLRGREVPPASVHVAGSFNDWSVEEDPMRELAPGVFAAERSLETGDYTYKFVVDGSDWFVDPAQPRLRDDGEGNTTDGASRLPNEHRRDGSLGTPV